MNFLVSLLAMGRHHGGGGIVLSWWFTVVVFTLFACVILMAIGVIVGQSREDIAAKRRAQGENHDVQ